MSNCWVSKLSLNALKSGAGREKLNRSAKMTDIGNCFGNESLYVAFPYALNLKVYSFGPLWDLYRSVLDTIKLNLPHHEIHQI